MTLVTLELEHTFCTCTCALVLLLKYGIDFPVLFDLLHQQLALYFFLILVFLLLVLFFLGLALASDAKNDRLGNYAKL